LERLRTAENNNPELYLASNKPGLVFGCTNQAPEAGVEKDCASGKPEGQLAEVNVVGQGLHYK